MSDRAPTDAEALLLALDAAGGAASVAVLRGDDVIADHAWTIESTPSEELLGAVDATLDEVGVARGDLDGIVVVTGPGGYGGLRAAVATAQGLAFGLDLRLAGIGRLDAEAARASVDAGTAVVAIHDAGRSGIAWAAYLAGADGDVEVTEALRLDEPSDVASLAPNGAAWCGELTERLREALIEAGRDAELASSDTTSAEEARPSRAAAAARLARRRSAFGDPAAVDVVYLRPPPITRPRGA